jgi:hypothetical protein
MLQVFRADVAKVDRGVSALRHEGGMEDVAEPWGSFLMLHEAFRDVSSGAI